MRATGEPLPSPFHSSYFLPTLSPYLLHSRQRRGGSGGRTPAPAEPGRGASSPRHRGRPAAIPAASGRLRSRGIAPHDGPGARNAGLSPSRSRLARGRCHRPGRAPPQPLRRSSRPARRRSPALTCSSRRRAEGSSSGHPLSPAGSMAARQRQAHVSPPSSSPPSFLPSPPCLPQGPPRPRPVPVTLRAPPPLTRSSRSRAAPAPRQAAPSSAPEGRERRRHRTERPGPPPPGNGPRGSAPWGKSRKALGMCAGVPQAALGGVPREGTRLCGGTVPSLPRTEHTQLLQPRIRAAHTLQFLIKNPSD